MSREKILSQIPVAQQGSDGTPRKTWMVSVFGDHHKGY